LADLPYSTLHHTQVLDPALIAAAVAEGPSGLRTGSSHNGRSVSQGGGNSFVSSPSFGPDAEAYSGGRALNGARDMASMTSLKIMRAPSRSHDGGKGEWALDKSSSLGNGLGTVLLRLTRDCADSL
jgi:hypothetical protein